ncbi:MAG TPA: VWA domain-containing protein [Kribbella sp.]
MEADSPLRRKVQTRTPLRRQPKQLEGEPTLFEPSPGGQGGIVLRSIPTGHGHRDPQRPAGTAPGSTDEAAALVTAPAESAPSDPVARARARQIAARLALRRPRLDVTSRRGSGELASVPYRGGSDDIDLDATIEMLAERPVPDDEDIIVRERVRTRRSVVLAVDVSGSMRGERIRNAAATVGALAAELVRDDLAVLAFWSDAAVLLHLGQPVRPLDLVDALLELPAKGLTNIAFPLQVAARELARVPARDARVVLLSDCVHNAGPDPRLDAARLARLDVLLDVSGEHDLQLGRELARAGHGRLVQIRQHRDVAPALTKVFAA